MNTRIYNHVTGATTLFALFLQMFTFTVTAQTLKQTNEETTEQFDDQIELRRKSKIAPDLEEKTNELFYGFRGDEPQKVIIQLKSETRLNEMSGNSLSESEQEALFDREVRENQTKRGILMGDLAAVNGRVKKSFDRLGLVSAELPLSKINKLVESGAVEYISPDREVRSFGHIGSTVGWYNPGIIDRGDSDPNTWLSGMGGGRIVVIDSGIDTNHNLMKWMDAGGNSKIKYSKDFTGQNITGDPYGHGTHVTTMLGGDWATHGGAYQAIANGSDLINLRVLNSTGQGTASNLIAALDWSVANKSTWNIRVVNVSLGTVARDSYKNDPLCLAARRAVNAGLVVVASAGNYGKDSLGNKLYGSIGSPGIEPSVITVGAANTFGTDSRADDTVATYSSRGPTRGYVTLSNGARKYDNLIKPDIVAPGNKLIGARGYYNGTENLLSRTYSALRTGTDTTATDQVMYLSGTSMAAPVVAGAAALLIDTNPKLTPNLVKAILMYSAQPLKNFSTLEQGAGLLNVDGAVRIARLVKTTLPTTNGAALLRSALPVSQSSNFWGTTVYWGKGIVTNHGFLYGNDLMNKWQGMYASGVLLSDGTPFSGTTLSKSTTKTSGTLSLYQGAIRNNGVLISDGTLFLSANAMGGSPTPFVNSQGVLVSDGVLISDGVLVSDGVLASDGVLIGDSNNFILGDNTSCMLPAP